MKIKSLLLGSAAALVAVSGVNAADAVIIPEPEVVEYVRVCDAYGTGYFYIPGTETCMKIHGYVRYDVGFGDLKEVTSATNDGTWNQRARMSLRLSTANETDYGTLRTYFEGRYQWDTNGASTTVTTASGTVALPGYTNTNEFSVNFAYIDLNGFRVGKDESYFTTFTGYAGGVINDTDAGGYGPFDTNLISYTFSGGAFSAGISLEQGDDSFYSPTSSFTTATYTGWGIQDYTPHVVIGLGYDAGVVNIRGVFGWDSRDDFVDPLGNFNWAGGWAGKIRLDADITDSLSGFIMVGYGQNNSAYTTWANGSPAFFDDETWTIIGGATYVFNDMLRANAQVQWVESGFGDIDDQVAVAANVNYNLTPRYVITPEIAWLNRFDGTDDFGGTLRFQASF